MIREKSKRRIVIVVTVFLCILFILIFLVPLVCPWTRLNCRCEDIDINSGRIRFQRYVLFCKISERIEDSAISKILWNETNIMAEPDWNRVNTFSPGLRHSPHYSFHAVFSQIHNLEILWEVFGFPEEAKKVTAKRVLQLWQQEGDYFGAGHYLRGLDVPESPTERGLFFEQIIGSDASSYKQE